VIVNPGSLTAPELAHLLQARMPEHVRDAVALGVLTGDKYKTLCRVLDINAQEIGAIKPRHQLKDKLDASVEVGAVNIAALPTGIYAIEISVLDAEDQVRAASLKRSTQYIEADPFTRFRDCSIENGSDCLGNPSVLADHLANIGGCHLQLENC